jgi:glycosyltransferase involved in cell wall biosynthesis
MREEIPSRTVIVIPAYNEAQTLVDKVLQLEEFTKNMSVDIIIANNASTDETGTLAARLADEYSRILYNPISEKGKGLAIKKTWLAHDYDIYAFMDADLSTDLEALPQLIEAAKQGVAIGSRYLPGSRTKRTLKRKIISKGYIALFKTLYGLGIGDSQCGFKAINRQIRDNVLPYVKDNGFFFDTELLVRASKEYKIIEVPVHWQEQPGTSLNMKRDIPYFLYNLMKLKYELMKDK